MGHHNEVHRTISLRTSLVQVTAIFQCGSQGRSKNFRASATIKKTQEVARHWEVRVRVLAHWLGPSPKQGSMAKLFDHRFCQGRGAPVWPFGSLADQVGIQVNENAIFPESTDIIKSNSKANTNRSKLLLGLVFIGMQKINPAEDPSRSLDFALAYWRLKDQLCQLRFGVGPGQNCHVDSQGLGRSGPVMLNRTLV